MPNETQPATEADEANEPAENAADTTASDTHSTRAANPLDDLSSVVTALQAELSDVQSKLEKADKDNLYLQAEFQNYRRRKEEEFISQQKYLSANLVKELLPIVDNFERALQAAEQHQSYEKLIGGVNGTLKQFQAFLQKSGVTAIDTVGREFDPNFHEAIGHTEDSDLPANTVAEEVQRGYVMHDRVLRPSLVKVSQG